MTRRRGHSLDPAVSEIRAWGRALLRGDAPPPAWLVAFAVSSILALSWFAIYALGGAGKVAPHWFYIPILLAAARFGLPGAWVTGAVAGLLAGPLMPLDVDAGTAQASSDWLSRSAFFLGIGTIMAWLVRRLQRALRRELMVLEQERELAQRSAAVIQSVGHEFRTPLTVLMGTAEMLRSRTLDPNEEARFLDGMMNAVGRLRDLVEVVTATSEALYGDTFSGAATDVNALCREVARELTDLGGERRVRVPEERVLATGDPRLLRVALRAVIENAMKFSGPEGAVDVTATRLDDLVAVAVRDRGPGIDRAVVRSSLAAPFAPERETAGAGGGLGLGLFAAGKAMERVGGSIEFQTPPHGGTRVVMLMPAANPGQAHSRLSRARSRVA